MSRTLIFISLTVLCIGPVAAADDAQSILEKMQQKQIERWRGVDSYIVEQTIMGNRARLYYERLTVTDADGKAVTTFRTVAPKQVASRQSAAQSAAPGMQSMTPEQLRQFADAQEMAGEGLGNEIESGMQKAGLPPGLLGATGSDPWATLDPRVMMGGNAKMLRAMADEKEKPEDDGIADAQGQVAATDTIARRAHLVGTETIDERKAFHIRADGLNQVQQADGRQFTLQTMNLWVDAKEYVPLKTKIDGVAARGAETTPITIEMENQDYRSVPDSNMYEPYKRVMRLGGIMDAEQQKQMAEAKQKMAEFETQLAQMPAAQRKMIMHQVGPQMEMMRSMSAGGGFEIVAVVDEIRVGETPESLALESTKRPASTSKQVATAPPENAATGSTSTSARDPQALEAAQQACLNEKIKQAQSAQKKKRGLSSLFSAVARTASHFGADQVMARLTNNVNTANATAEDLASAAKDLGVSEDEIAACQDPA